MPKAVIVHGSKWKPIPYGSGGSIVMWRNLKSVESMGYEVESLVFDVGKPMYYPEQMLLNIPETTTLPTKKVKRKFKGWLKEILGSLEGVFWGLYPYYDGNIIPDKSQKIDNVLKPDLVLCENMMAFFLSKNIWPNVPYILCIHDLDYDLRFRKKNELLKRFKGNSKAIRIFLNRLQWKLDKARYHKLISELDGILFIGRSMEEEIGLKNESGKTTNIAIPEPPISYREIIKIRETNFEQQGKFNILYVGKLDNSHTRKSLPHLIKAFQKFKNQSNYDKIVLRIVGDYSRSMQIYNRYKNFENVEFAGFVENIKDEYLNSIIQIVPEGFLTGVRIKIAESFSYALPVLSTKMELYQFNLPTDISDFIIDDLFEGLSEQLFKICEDKDYRLKQYEKAWNIFESEFHPSIVIKKVSEGIQSFLMHKTEE